MSPAISITLTDLGLGDLIVGRHAFDRSLDPAIPVVGDQTGIDYETLARTNPTHVLLEQTADGLPGLLNRLADERGWVVESLPMLALDDIPAAVDQLARLFQSIAGVSTRAAPLHRRMDIAWRPRPELAPRTGRTLIVYWVSPIGVAGPGSFHHDLLKRMGFEVVPATGSPYITLDLEDLNRLDPDSILLLTPDLNPDDLDGVIEPWRKLGLCAVDANRIAILNDWRFLTPSSAMIDFADRVVEAVSAWPVNSDDAGPSPGKRQSESKP